MQDWTDQGTQPRCWDLRPCTLATTIKDGVGVDVWNQLNKTHEIISYNNIFIHEWSNIFLFDYKCCYINSEV